MITELLTRLRFLVQRKHDANRRTDSQVVKSKTRLPK